jgi:aspartyl-tRNA(Asn)/glutamyl-tRNA(Gln) amidotransferase subunit A
MSDELCFLSAEELAVRYRRRDLSPVEVTRAVLDRIDRVNPTINAISFVDPVGAIAAARVSEQRWRRAEPIGALDGVPVTLKETIPVAGMPTPKTARAADVYHDAPSAQRLREAGAVLLGKTAIPDLSMIPSGISSEYGITRNPWNLGRNSGGSSSGAAAAVAAGFGPLAVGSDMGGSVRIPAAFCGIVGLKPSYGRVPVETPWQALVAGPMARTVSDVAQMLNVLARPDLRDYTALPWDERDYLAQIDDGVRGRRAALLLDIGFGIAVQPEVRALVEAAASVFERLGASVEAMSPIFDEDPEPAFDRMMQAYAWTEFEALSPENRGRVMPEVADWCRLGEGLSAAVLARATAAIGEIRGRVIAATAPYDLVLSPTMGMEAFGAERPWADGGTRHNPFCFPFNLSEQPAVSICCGFTSSGLPVGLQIVGRRFDDAGVLRAARAYERARPPLPGRPPL